MASAQRNPQRGGAPPNPSAERHLHLTSPAFTDGSTLPVQYTCVAKDWAGNPPLQWTDVPMGTASFVLIAHDLEARGRKSVEDSLHWMLWNIPSTATSIPEGVPITNAELPDGWRQGTQPGNPTPGFRKPCPIGDLPHHYTFELYALDQKVDVPVGATRADLFKAMDGHILDRAILIGVFQR
jgi:hypothetical protein